MRRRRIRLRRASGAKAADVETTDLCRGPGNLTVAMGITRRFNRADLTCGPLRIEDWGTGPVPLEWSRRIGIRVALEHEWRCNWRGHGGVSGPRSLAIGNR
jgi:3-methyladenine DNA glycosylase Mpg